MQRVSLAATVTKDVEVNVDDNGSDVDEIDEKRDLEEALHLQESVCQGLRQQCVSYEEELDETKTRLREANRQRDLYEEESDEISQQLHGLRKELASTKNQLATERSKKLSAVPQSASGFNVQELKATADTARMEAKEAREHSEYVCGMLNAVIQEREQLKYELQHAHQPFADDVSRLQNVNDHLRDSIDGLQGQIGDLLQQKESADDRTIQLGAELQAKEAHNQTLLENYTNEFIADPRDVMYPFVCTPNEARDLRQQVESAQATSAQFIEANQVVMKELAVEKAEVARLKTDKDLLSKRCGRLSSNFEILQSRANSFIATMTKVEEDNSDMSEEDITAHNEQICEYEAHIAKTKQCLKNAAIDLSDVESSKAAMERRHKSEVAFITERVEELQGKNIRYDVDNFELDMKLNEAQKQIQGLEQRLQESQDAAHRWRYQCEEQAFGDTATVMRETHQARTTELGNQITALQHMNTELRIGRERADRDADLFTLKFANTMTNIGTWEAEWLFARAKCAAIEERFAEELRANPLRIQRHDQYENLTQEKKMEILRLEDHWIEVAIGMKLGRGQDTQPPTQVQTWATFIAECQAPERHGDQQPYTPTVRSTQNVQSAAQPEEAEMTPLPAPGAEYGLESNTPTQVPEQGGEVSTPQHAPFSRCPIEGSTLDAALTVRSPAEAVTPAGLPSAEFAVKSTTPEGPGPMGNPSIVIQGFVVETYSQEEVEAAQLRGRRPQGFSFEWAI